MAPVEYRVVDAEDGGIGGGIVEEPGGPQRVVFYVEVDDLQAYVDKAESLGGKTVVPVTEVPGMVTFALVSDTEGNTIGIVQGDSS